MTDEEYHELARAVVGLLEPYAATGKIAGFRMVLAVFVDDNAVTPLVLGSHKNAEIGALLCNPEFADSVSHSESILPPELRKN